MLRVEAQCERTAAPVILFLGAPGSGKGTQSALLSSTFGIPCLSTGDILRSQAREDNAGAARLRRILASGSLVGDETVCRAVRARLRRDVPANGVILDGFPRTLKQAECLHGILAELGMPQPMVLHLNVSRERLLERLTARRQCPDCGAIFNLVSRPSLLGSRCETDGASLFQREDDKDAVILRRLTDFEHRSAPLVEYYRRANYHRIDGDRDPHLVSAELVAIFGNVAVAAAA